MPKGSEELTQARREEIIQSCASLYETMSFKDTTIKEIGAATSFTRTSIYNYFLTSQLQRHCHCGMVSYSHLTCFVNIGTIYKMGNKFF